MQIALYKGISLMSRGIRFVTRSDFSHAAFVCDKPCEEAAIRLRERGIMMPQVPFTQAGAVIEAWEPGGVRNTPGIRYNHAQHTPVEIYDLCIPLTSTQEENLLLWCAPKIGDPYDWKNVFKFVTRRPGHDDDAWFCSEFCFDGLKDVGRELFARTEAWEVSPGLIARSRELVRSRSLVI